MLNDKFIWEARPSIFKFESCVIDYIVGVLFEKYISKDFHIKRLSSSNADSLKID